MARPKALATSVALRSKMASPRLARRVWTCASWRIGALLGGQPCEHLLPSPEHFDPACVCFTEEATMGTKTLLQTLAMGRSESLGASSKTQLSKY